MKCDISNIKFNEKYRVKSARHPNHDYSSNGVYFITICTLNKNKFFGKIIDNKMELSNMGIIVNQCLIDISKHFSNVTLEEYVVMPNHVHILFRVETPYMASLQDNQKVTLINYSHRNHPDYYSRLNQKSKQLIPKIIQQFKSAVTHQINPQTIFFGWQSRFFDEIVKDEKHYWTIKNYIKNNPKNWEKDDCFI